MSEDQGFEGLYEVVKTVRFGLSQNPYKTNTSKSEVLKSLVNSTFSNLQNEKNKKNSLNDEKLINKVTEFITLNQSQLLLWESAFENFSKIELTKTTYKSLSKKANFKYTKPDSSSIKLNGIDKNNAISIQKYFDGITKKNYSLITNFQVSLDQFKEALKPNSNHKKPNIISFRKQFLSIVNVCFDWLIPAINHEIQYSDSEFVKTLQDRENLSGIGVKLKDYFQQNGSIVPFAKVTLNYWTARQKPENFSKKIKSLIEQDLEILKLYEKLNVLDSQELEDYFKFQTYLSVNNKYKIFSDTINSNLTQIELAQVFKPKPIKADVKFSLVERMKKDYGDKIDQDKLLKILNEIGKPIDIANDFDKWTKEDGLEAKDFDLNKYPLKLAFDYAWENLSKNMRSGSEGKLTDYKFAKQQSIELLKSLDIQDPENDSNLKFYSDLSFIKEELVVVEYEKDENIKCSLERIELAKRNVVQILNKISDSVGAKHKNNLINSLNSPEKRDFQDSKQNLGKLRGDLKNKVPNYYKLTKKFKEIASFLGGNFAELRDKLREENQINKISHYGVIIENQKDKYLLALPLNPPNQLKKEKTDRELDEYLDIMDKKLIDQSTDFKTKKINSLTSKTLNKILKNPGGYKDFHYFENKQAEKNYKVCVNKNWNEFILENDNIQYIIESLTISKMATAQNWHGIFSCDSFDWNTTIKKCTTYEQIEKMLDLKGYKLEERYIDPQDIKKLVNEHDCLLLPITNQDYQSHTNLDKFTGNDNQFTTDFENALSKNIEDKNGIKSKYRLHPELTLFYKLPAVKPENGQTEQDLINNHHAQTLNRNSRFQIIGNFGIEIKPELGFDQIERFKNRKGKNKITRDGDEYQKVVTKFNQNISSDFENTDSKREWIYGFDRGINELATLCVLHKNSKQIASFVVFMKTKIERTKKGRIAEINSSIQQTFTYTSFKVQHILNLTNIKVETWHFDDENHPNSIYLKDALNKIKQNAEQFEIAKKLGYFDESGNIPKSIKILVEYSDPTSSNVTKLKINHFQRALSLAISQNREGVAYQINEVWNIDDGTQQVEKLFELNILDKSQIKIDIAKNIELFRPIFDQIKEWKENKGKPNYLREFKKKYEEIEDLDTLKRGIVANMVGTTSFLMEKYPGIIVLEDLAKENYQRGASHGLQRNVQVVSSDQENVHITWAGTETYRYFEKMLVRKFEKQGLVPPFADLESLNVQTTNLRGNKIDTNKQFGIIYYIDAAFTSKTCPCCNGICKRRYNHVRHNQVCEFDSRLNDLDPTHLQEEGQNKGKPFYNPDKVTELANKYNLIPAETLLKITNGDQNASYNIANKIFKLLKN